MWRRTHNIRSTSTPRNNSSGYSTRFHPLEWHLLLPALRPQSPVCSMGVKLVLLSLSSLLICPCRPHLPLHRQTWLYHRGSGRASSHLLTDNTQSHPRNGCADVWGFAALGSSLSAFSVLQPHSYQLLGWKLLSAALRVHSFALSADLVLD